MARVNIYLPDDLAEEAREAELNVSGIAQDALRGALAARRTTEWLARLPDLSADDVSHADALAALDEVRAESGDGWPAPPPGRTT